MPKTKTSLRQIKAFLRQNKNDFKETIFLWLVTLLLTLSFLVPLTVAMNKRQDLQPLLCRCELERLIETSILDQSKYCYKWTANDEQNQYVRYAAKISNNDLNFIATLDAENGLWKPDRQSNVWNNGVREPSYGFCMIHRSYHPKIANDPRFFSDPYWQLDTCWRLYSEGTKMYGYDNRWKHKTFFTCPE